MKHEIEYLGNIKRTVLVVDDEEINREILGGILEDTYDVLFADGGDSALKIVREKKSILSLVLLDLRMPGTDGFTVMDTMQADDELRSIPIIVLTAEESAEIDSLKRGASDFIKKPYDMPEKILARVGRIIDLFEERMIIRSTERDELTGLLSLNYFFEYASMKDKYMPGREMDAVTVNINNFHLYNEMFGIQTGEKALCRVAEILKEYVKNNDGLAGRSDADNFCLYLPHHDDYEDLAKIIASGIHFDNEVFNVAFRIGVNTHKAGSTERLEVLFNRARVAAEGIIGKHGERIAYYDTEMASQRIFEEKLIRDIANAMLNQQIQVAYQPKYEVTGGKPVLVGAEALVRWKHPQYGMLYPNTFISLFEGNGLIQALDDHVWHEVASQIKAWKDKFGFTLPISVNVSRVDLLDEKIVHNLCETVKEAGIEPADMHLEVTESAYVSDVEHIITTINRFREKGFIIEMDDFGSGYSSLNMLTTMPIDVLKVDMQFLSDITENIKSEKIMRLIVEIANFLNIPITVEGVEEKEQFDLLRMIGCGTFQGFYFSKPVPAEEFEEFFKD